MSVQMHAFHDSSGSQLHTWWQDHCIAGLQGTGSTLIKYQSSVPCTARLKTQ